MILDRTVRIRIGNHYFNLLKNKYEDIKLWDYLEIEVSDLSPTSSIKINVKCDVCENEKKLTYLSYMNGIKNGGFYACSQKCAYSKNKKTYLEKTGYENQMLNPEVIKKFRNTCLNNFGYDHPKKSELYIEKGKKTCLKNYGVEFPLKSSEILDRAKNTNMERYGVDNPMKLKEIREKSESTNLERYGNKTSLLNKDVKNKAINSMKEKYGYEHALQNKEIMEKMISNSKKFKTHKETCIIYQGKYEKDFLDLCFINNIDVERGKTFKYISECDNKEHFYFSDFLIKQLNLIVEVKSTYYYKLHLQMNINKKASVIENENNYILILDKKYDEFLSIIKRPV